MKEVWDRKCFKEHSLLPLLSGLVVVFRSFIAALQMAIFHGYCLPGLTKNPHVS